jgi:hypothetical protein
MQMIGVPLDEDQMKIILAKPQSDWLTDEQMKDIMLDTKLEYPRVGPEYQAKI